MHRVNNAVIMQTEQLGQIEALEEELRSSRVKMVKMEQKMTEQDHVIAQLVGDNLNHLQDNMRLSAHINSLQERVIIMTFWYIFGTVISCLSWQYSGLYLSPTLPTLLPASDIPDWCTIRGLLHNYHNPPPTNYFCIFPTIHSILQP